ncbi:Microspherule protein [Echinococcus granulosus]|uniref:Microspherule protein n=1 Tax=Echinococcus granulosus TaxID=6210 RepID=W6UML5_ECHGR|nr:Microspherule protein [Echinococcus granulosus]EUB59372.1 Microspherule protein [Echinococcus granulosus]
MLDQTYEASALDGFHGCYLLVSLNPHCNGRTYVGYTVNPKRRIQQHNSGSQCGGAKSTGGKGPWGVLARRADPNLQDLVATSCLRRRSAWMAVRVGELLCIKRVSQSRSKQRTRDIPGIHNRWKQIDPPWRPEDDYLLIHSLFVTCNLAEVCACVRFTRSYTESEVEQRWRLLLFNPAVSKTSREAIFHMPQAVKCRLDAQIPFSGEEDALLMTISYNEVFKNAEKYFVFEKLLNEHPRLNKASDVGGDPESFSDTEFIIQETTARVMQAGLPHLMESSNIARRKRLLASAVTYHGFQASVSQAVADSLVKYQRSYSFCATSSLGSANRILPRSPSWAGFRSEPIAVEQSDFSNSAQDEFVSEVQLERYRARRRLHAKKARVEEEARRWTALVESKVANGIVISDHQPIYPTLATLTGRRSRFLIKCKNVTFGRAVQKFAPDIDLSREGEASRISRHHGKISLADNGVFWLTNLSRHPVLVDGSPVLKDQKYQLADKSIVCISHLSLRFDVEHEHILMLSGLENTVAVGGLPFLLPTDKNQNDEDDQAMDRGV